MGHIKSSLLVDNATIYNVWRDPDTGELFYFRSVVEAVRFMDKTSAVNVTGIGWAWETTQVILVDALNSSVADKEYLDPFEWAAISEAVKPHYWTMQEGDFVLQGEFEFEVTPDNIIPLTSLNPRKIKSINTVRQKGGDTNHWEVSLV